MYKLIVHSLKINLTNCLKKDCRRTLTTVKLEHGIKTVTLNHLEKRNALSMEMLKKLKQDILDDLGNPSLRSIILRSDGPVFSSGHDLKELSSANPSDYHKEIFSTCSEVMSSIRNSPVPVIAEVKGVAAAAGFQLVASCDIIIASKNSKFSVPGANVGIFCSTPGIAVARALPPKIAAYLLLTGFSLNSEEAYQCGFVSKIVPEEELEEETLKTAKAISSKSRAVIELGKSFYYKQIEMDLQAAYREGEKIMIENLQLKDAQEGIKAFLEKRKPQWKHNFEKNVF